MTIKLTLSNRIQVTIYFSCEKISFYSLVIVGNKSVPRGGYSNSSAVSNRYPQDDFSSYANYPSANSSYNNNRNNYGGNFSQGYPQNYSSNKFSGSRLNDSFNNESSFSQQAYANESSYSYGQYDSPNPPSSRYGYPPYNSSGMGDYNQRQGGGPMRGASRPSRGGASGYGNYPY